MIENLRSKHIFAQRSRITSVKRRLSSTSKEDSSEKRFYEEEGVEEEGIEIMDKQDIQDALRAVLQEDSMSDMLAKAFEKSLNKMTEKIEQLQKKDENKEFRLARIEERLDRQTQDSRGRNIIITGLQKDDMTKENVVAKFNELLTCNLEAEDIKWVQKLVADEDSIRKRKGKLRVVFKEEDKRNDVFKLKPNLKGKNIWLTDDLTASMSSLAYLARQALKNEKIKNTWVFGGKIFIVKDGDDRPIRVSRKEDIPS